MLFFSTFTWGGLRCITLNTRVSFTDILGGTKSLDGHTTDDGSEDVTETALFFFLIILIIILFFFYYFFQCLDRVIGHRGRGGVYSKGKSNPNKQKEKENFVILDL